MKIEVSLVLKTFLPNRSHIYNPHFALVIGKLRSNRFSGQSSRLPDNQGAKNERGLLSIANAPGRSVKEDGSS